MYGHAITAVQQAELASAAPRTDESVLADDAVSARKRFTQRAANGIDRDHVAGEHASTDALLFKLYELRSQCGQCEAHAVTL